MKNQKIMEKIKGAIEIVRPLFKVTDKEYKKFQTPEIIRELKEKDYPEWFSSPARSKYDSGYDALRNLFYFPKEFPSQEEIKKRPYLEVSASNLVGLVSRYVHHQINPKMLHGSVIFYETGSFPEGHKDIIGLVSSYPDIELGKITIQEFRGLLPFSHYLKIYFDKGRHFLPILARMSLQEAIDKEIVPFGK